MTCIDFSSVLYDGLHYPKGARHVPRPNCLFADHGPLAGTPFQSMRQSLSRRSSYSNLYLSRSVLLHEFCPTVPGTYKGNHFQENGRGPGWMVNLRGGGTKTL